MPKRKIILKGTGASPGIVKGRVRLVRSAEEIEMLDKKEILVTPFINPDFLPSIKRHANICGVVTDKGGVTCHAAIVMRELKICYVAGVGNATKKLKDNMEVEIDGRKGIVYEGS